MKRCFYFFLLFTLVSSLNCLASGDSNALDDIGFDNAYSYYSSGDESINMQTGNVNLSIPVSPVYPGPAGSGLDIQLTAYYNSHTWRYNRNKDRASNHFNCPGSYEELEFEATVDHDHMYFSPVGFGWQLHMGRLFRLKKQIAGECYSTQYYYEDPSGAIHDFGPYCGGHTSVSPDGEFWSQNGSDYYLYVHNYDIPGERTIVLHHKSGLRYYFDDPDIDAPTLDVPLMPGQCSQFSEPTASEFDDKVFYVRRIEDYPGTSSVEINYNEPSGLLHNEHLISNIIDSFGRKITFQYDENIVSSDGVTLNIPVLSSVCVPAFKGDVFFHPDHNVTYTFKHDDGLRNLYEPSGFADCHFESGYEETSYFHWKNVPVLTGITLPEGSYSHEFDYLEWQPEGYETGTTGEIHVYTDPLDSRTTYTYKDIDNISTVEQVVYCDFSGYPPEPEPWSAIVTYKTPSRFLHTKTLTYSNPSYADTDYTWHYKVVPHHQYLQGAEFYPDYEDVFIDNILSNNWGKIYPITAVMNPDGDEVWYSFKDEGFYIVKNGVRQYSDPYDSTWWNECPQFGEYEIPEDDNSFNGRLERTWLVEGGHTIVKEQSFGVYFDENCGDCNPDTGIVDNPCYLTGLDFASCHSNRHVNRANIRKGTTETMLYGTSGSVVKKRKEIHSYDDYGNVTAFTISADGLNDIITYRQYQHVESPGRYKVDFLDWEETYEVVNGVQVLVSRTDYNNNLSTGRVESYTVTNTNQTGQYCTITTLLEYDSLNQLKLKRVGDSPAVNYTYAFGTLGSEASRRNSIHKK